MAGECKICGFEAGIFNLKNGLCKNCRNIDGTDSLITLQKNNISSARTAGGKANCRGCKKTQEENALFCGDCGKINRGPFFLELFGTAAIMVICVAVATSADDKVFRAIASVFFVIAFFAAKNALVILFDSTKKF